MKKVSYPVIDSRATGANIKRLMQSKNITPGELGEYMGFVDARAIYKWMEGRSLPSLDNMLALARALETPIERLS